MNEYESMREEIKRLHKVCRIKDAILQDAINALSLVIDQRVMSTNDTKTLTLIVKELKKTIG